MNIGIRAAILVACSLLLSGCSAQSGKDSAESVSSANGGSGLDLELGAANSLDKLMLRVFSDVADIATGGVEVATITALVADSENYAVSGAELSFSATAGVLQVVNAITDGTGRASATLVLPKDYENKDIVVTVSANDGSESSVKVAASGSDLVATGATKVAAGELVQLSIRLTDGNGKPIADQLVAVASVAGNTVTPAESVTDIDGQTVLSVSSENYSDTLLISALNGTVSAVHSFEVVEELLTFTNAEEGVELLVGNESVLTTRWTRFGQPVIGEALTFSISEGSIVAPATVFTDLNGDASVRVGSNSVEQVMVSVKALSSDEPKADIGIEFIATVPQKINISLFDSVVDVNESRFISAVVTDALDNPVKNSEVAFTSFDLQGGRLDQAQVVTNSAGIASVTFTAGNTSSEPDDIRITSVVQGTGIVDSTSLSVVERSLSISIGSDNEVLVNQQGTQYAFPMIVHVNDSSGAPLGNMAIELAVRPLSYGKGVLELVNGKGFTINEVSASGEQFDAARWAVAADSIDCPAEDLNGDLIVDTFGNTTEDRNSNGILDPQEPASLDSSSGESISLPGASVQTDINGSGLFELSYPASNAAWAYVEVTARAEIQGEIATDTYTVRLPMPTSVENAVDDVPENLQSPYGSDIQSDTAGQVVLSNRLMDVYRGCMTSL